MGKIDPVDIVANVASGGLYGVGKGISNAVQSGNPADALSALDLGPASFITNVSDQTIGPDATLALKLAATGGALGAGAGGGAGAALGATAGQQAGNLAHAFSTQPFIPQSYGRPEQPFIPQSYGQPAQATPQQLAALTANQSEAHRGLAPRFEQRMGGQQEDPGLAALYNLYPQG